MLALFPGKDKNDEVRSEQKDAHKGTGMQPPDPKKESWGGG